MDKVFVSGASKRPKKTRKFRFSGFANKKEESDEDLDEYFPFSGGGSPDEYTYREHLSYQPEQVLEDSAVQLIQPDGLGRRVRKILVRGSRYNVFDIDNGADQDGDESEPSIEGEQGERVNKNGLVGDRENTQKALSEAAGSGASGSGASLATVFGWMDSIPVTSEDAVPLIRRASRASGVLLFLDQYIDGMETQLPGSEVVLSGIELFLLMLLGYAVARVVEIICLPAVLIAELVWSFFA